MILVVGASGGLVRALAHVSRQAVARFIAEALGREDAVGRAVTLAA